MKKGKTTAAVKLLSSNMQGGVLPLNEETKKLLLEKHPEPSPISHEALVESIAEEIHPVVFDEIDGESIRKAMMATKGGAGTSGLDADGWRHILLSKNFKAENEELRNQLAICTRKLAKENVKSSLNFIYGLLCPWNDAFSLEIKIFQ